VVPRQHVTLPMISGLLTAIDEITPLDAQGCET
jgi:hypothetical protein